MVTQEDLNQVKRIMKDTPFRIFTDKEIRLSRLFTVYKSVLISFYIKGYAPKENQAKLCSSDLKDLTDEMILPEMNIKYSQYLKNIGEKEE